MRLFGRHPWCHIKWETVEYYRTVIVGSYKHRRATCTECDYIYEIFTSRSYDEDWRLLRDEEKDKKEDDV